MGMVTGGLGAMSLAISAADNSVAAKKNALKVVGGVLLLSVASDVVDMTQDAAVSAGEACHCGLYSRSTRAHMLAAMSRHLLACCMDCDTAALFSTGLRSAAAAYRSADCGGERYAGCALPLAVFTQGKERLKAQVG